MSSGSGREDCLYILNKVTLQCADLYEGKLGFARQVLTSVSCEGLPELVGQVGLFITVLNRVTSQCADLYEEKLGFARQVLTSVSCTGLPKLVGR